MFLHTGVHATFLIIYANTPQMDKYLIEKHTCGTYKNYNSCISLHCLLVSLPMSAILCSLGVTCDCDAGVLPHYVCEIIQIRTPCFFCLLPWMATRKQGGLFTNTIFQSHSRTTTTTPFSLLPSVNPVTVLEERPGHYEKPLMSVWRGVVMRGILQPFISAGRHLTGGQPTGCVII